MEIINCEFRAVQKGRSICTVAQLRSDRHIDTIEQSVCQACPIPQIIKAHPCQNLSVGTQIMLQQTRPTLVSYAVDCEWKPFGDASEVDNCDGRCPKWQPVQLTFDLTRIEPLLHAGDPNLSDSVLRQAVLLALYSYHCEFPERYGMFDVTPDYLMKTLEIDASTLARVILPMAESELIKLRRIPGDTLFTGAMITLRGIEHVDQEPLLGQLNTANVRLMGGALKTEPTATPAAAEPGRPVLTGLAKAANGTQSHRVKSGIFKNSVYERQESHPGE